MTHPAHKINGLHPLLAAAVEKRSLDPQYPAMSVTDVRNLARARQGVPERRPEVHSVEDFSFAGLAGIIPARLYRPSAGSNLPLIVYFHGGGFVTGDLDSHDSILRHLVNASGAMVLSVDYRLAPEHPFPAAVEDADMALQFAISNAAAFSADPNAIFAAGDSAGATLALAGSAVTEKLAGLLLFYPVTDLTRIGDTESYARFGDGSAGLSQGDMQWLAGHYAPEGIDRREWRCSPLYAGPDIHFPPVFIVTAEYDVLRSEGEAFAQLLQDRGVSTEHHAVPGVNHGFLGADNAVPQVASTFAAASAWIAACN